MLLRPIFFWYLHDESLQVSHGNDYHCTVLHYIKHALMSDIYGANNLAPQCPNYTEIIT